MFSVRCAIEFTSCEGIQQSPAVHVYDARSVYQQLEANAREFLSTHVHVDADAVRIAFPDVERVEVTHQWAQGSVIIPTILGVFLVSG